MGRVSHLDRTKVRFFVITLALLLIWSFSAFAGLESPIPSQVEELTIPNSHEVSSNIFRGMAPRSPEEVDQLIDMGIQKILIFKNQTRTEVDDELQLLAQKGYSEEDILHIDMPWKDIHNFKAVCQKTIGALQFLLDSVASNTPTFFHCTVGEDRTGYLAGLFRLWNTKLPVQDIFYSEMCERGYGAGNPFKPKGPVVSKIRQSLTPSFLKMSWVLRYAKKKGYALDKQLCEQTFFENYFQKKSLSYRCSPTSLLQ